MAQGEVALEKSLAGKRVALWPVTPEDYQFLYWVATTDQNAYRWRYRMQIPPFEQFVQQLYTDVLSQLVAREIVGGNRVGHAVCYGADHRSLTARIGCVVSEEVVGLGYGVEILTVFIDHLFRCWPFRKLYAEVPEFTFGPIEAAGHPFGDGSAENGFVVEGRLTEYLYLDGRYWDMYLVSILADRWTELKASEDLSRFTGDLAEGQRRPPIAM